MPVQLRLNPIYIRHAQTIDPAAEPAVQHVSAPGGIVTAMTYTIGVRGCQHLGYTAPTMRMHSTGPNLRAIDGYVAHRATMQSMLDAQVDGIIDGGDLAHWSVPVPRVYQTATDVDDMRVNSPRADDQWRWYRGNTGNHDAGAGTAVSAAVALHRPTLDAHVVFPGNQSPFGPLPGLYEVHQPDPDVPLFLHIVSHNGLAAGTGVDPQPIKGGINLLFAHGIFVGDPRMRVMLESHGEQRIVPVSWVERGWDQVLLSDIHTLGVVPGFDDPDGCQVWYTGSSVRRGFSDTEGDRGWLKVTIDEATSRVTVQPQTVWQRPQTDLPIIDAAGLTSTEVDDMVSEALGRSDWWDAESADLTGDGGHILRQRIVGVTPTLRRALTPLFGRWESLAKRDGQGAAWWKAELATDTAGDATSTGGVSRTITSHVVDFAADLLERSHGDGKVAATLASLPPKDRDTVLAAAHHLLADTGQRG